jgi:tetratricopeptide (TPR) repeat protein
MSAEAMRVAAEKLEGSRQHGDACLEWALCLTELGRFQEAREAGEQAAALHRAACGDHSDELALDYEKLGSICQKQEDFPAAVSYLEKALGIRERQVGGDTSEMALLMVALADLYTLIGRLAPALELLQQAVGKLGPSKDSNLAGALEKLGSVYTRTGRYEDAAGCYQRAYDFWAASPEDYADRITANRQALESLLPWLPEPAAPPPKPETPDSGISVLREQSPARTTAGPEPAMPAFPALRAVPQTPPPAPGGAASPPAEALPATTPDLGSPPALPGARIAAQPVPLPPQAPVPAALTNALQPGAGPQAADVASSVPAPPTGPAIAPQPVALPAQPAAMALPAGMPPALPEQEPAGLHALSAAVPPRQDGHGFHGWEELEFDRLPR